MWKMPTPYAVVLRWRAVWLNIAHGFSSQEVSNILCLSKCTVQRYLTLFHQTGDVQPATHRNGAQKLLGNLEQLRLLQLILQNMSICRTLKFMGYTRQVICHIALQQSELHLCQIYVQSIFVWPEYAYLDRWERLWPMKQHKEACLQYLWHPSHWSQDFNTVPLQKRAHPPLWAQFLAEVLNTLK